MTLKVIGCPARPLLLAIAILSCLLCIPLLNWELSVHDAIVLASFLENVFLIVAMLKRNSKLLNISRYFTLIGLIVFGLIPSFILPIFYASMAGAGLMSKVLNGTGYNWPQAWADALPDTDTDVRNFWMGFAFGMVLEIMYWVLIGVTYLKYVLTTELWKMEMEKEKVMEAHPGKEFNEV